MGIVFYTCSNEKCKRNFPDCIDFFSCDCGFSFCSKECGEKQVSYDEDDEEIKTCILCREEQIQDGTLLSFLISYYNITYEKAIELYKEHNEK